MGCVARERLRTDFDFGSYLKVGGVTALLPLYLTPTLPLAPIQLINILADRRGLSLGQVLRAQRHWGGHEGGLISVAGGWPRLAHHGANHQDHAGEASRDFGKMLHGEVRMELTHNAPVAIHRELQ